MTRKSILCWVVPLALGACSGAKPSHAAKPTDATTSDGEPVTPWSSLGATSWPKLEGKTIRAVGYVFVSLSICGRKPCTSGGCANYCNHCQAYLSLASQKIPDEPRDASWDKIPSLGLAGSDPADFSCEKPENSCQRSCTLEVGGKYEVVGRFHDGIIYGVSPRPVAD
jgi:hypothetical protein